MKNIHLIPTDKPSRLYEFGGRFNIQDKEQENFRNFNIYITSDEEIKEGQNYIEDGFSGKNKFKWHKSQVELYPNIKKDKIILTTDADLIKDGVQAIDDEFLEWFVKNPSCEEVETIHGLFNPMGRQVDPMNLGQNHSQCVWKYKIIIPKEEPKQENRIDTCYNFNKEIGCVQAECRCEQEEPKQETLEEFIESYVNRIDRSEDGLVEKCLEDGAKWQAERMYSEDKVIILLNKFGGKVYGDYTRNQTMEDFTEEWFEQYKKK
jgi:hypothetical protein